MLAVLQTNCRWMDHRSCCAQSVQPSSERGDSQNSHHMIMSDCAQTTVDLLRANAISQQGALPSSFRMYLPREAGPRRVELGVGIHIYLRELGAGCILICGFNPSQYSPFQNIFSPFVELPCFVFLDQLSTFNGRAYTAQHSTHTPDQQQRLQTDALYCP